MCKRDGRTVVLHDERLAAALVLSAPPFYGGPTRRAVSDRRKPAFADLLTPAPLVQSDDDVGLERFEISGRVVECKMAVLANPDKGDIHGRRCKLAPVLLQPHARHRARR